MVRIKYDDIDKKINVGREMLTCFVRESNRGEYCFYLNGNTLDDRLDNLEWSCKKNVNNAFKGTPVEVKYNDNDQVVRFDSVADAAEELDVKTSEIYDSMRVGVVVHNLDHVTIKYIRENPAENATIKDIYFGNKIINVSSDGFVCVNGTNKWKRGGIQRGYMRTSFQFDKEGVYVVGGKGKQYDIHRLVATAFYDNPLGHTDVDHIDEDKCNNNVENLRWLSHSKNVTRGDKFRHMKKVYKYTLSGEYTGEYFDDGGSAAKSMGVEKNKKEDSGAISNCCNGKKGSWKGFEWSFYDPENYTKHREEIKESVRAARIIEAVNAKARRAAKGPPKTLGKRVYGHVIGTDEIIEWKSGKDADDKTKIGRGNISNYAKDKKVKEIEVDILDEEGKIIMEENIPKKRKVTVKFSYEN